MPQTSEKWTWNKKTFLIIDKSLLVVLQVFCYLTEPLLLLPPSEWLMCPIHEITYRQGPWQKRYKKLSLIGFTETIKAQKNLLRLIQTLDHFMDITIFFSIYLSTHLNCIICTCWNLSASCKFKNCIVLGYGHTLPWGALLYFFIFFCFRSWSRLDDST